jgi:lipoprotein NlpD
MLMTHPYRWAALVAGLLILAGCASPTHRAPVEDRNRAGAPGSATGPAASAPPRVLPGAENAGKPGYYTVKSGDTLIRISLDSGQNWRDIASWNSLDNPNLIEVGQVLRVVAPGTDPSAITPGVATRPVATAKLDVKPLEGKGGKPNSSSTAGASAGSGSGASASSAGAGTATAGAASTASTAGKAAAGGAAAASAGAGAAAGAAGGVVGGAASTPTDERDTKEARESSRDADEPNWMWPANGPTIASFEDGKQKGLSIGGKAGDPVFASADGHVVYAGSGLRGYGNLIILKHGGKYLTAYAHNQTLLVKEEQAVRRGQKIAEMGATDADRVQLHFEIRKQGKPIDPARQLPSR